MIQHVTLEVRPSDVEHCVAFYLLVGFERVSPPQSLADRVEWLQHGPTQLHLLHTEDSPGEHPGHFAVVVDDYEATLRTLREAGHEPDPRGEHWGSPRVYVADPAGNRVEVMAFGPGAVPE